MPRSRLGKQQISLLRFNTTLWNGDGVTGQHHATVEQNGPRIECSTEVVTLSEAPAYIALSYTWGDAKDTTPIFLDNDIVEVTTNLEVALAYVKAKFDISLAFWVDSICINQEDDVEKSEQVSHMREIYVGASKVIIWLGAHGDSPDVDLALDWIEHFGSRAEKLLIGKTPERVLRRLLTVQKHGTQEERLKDPEHEEISDFLERLTTSLDASANPEYYRLITALQGLLSRTYWSRIWVVQEFVLAREHEFLCEAERGLRSLEFMWLRYASRLLRNFRRLQLTTMGLITPTVGTQQLTPMSSIQAIPIDTRDAISLFKTQRVCGDLMHMLQQFITFKSSDPRDRIFALLGVSEDAADLGIVPDYSKGCDQVYTEAARALVKHGFFDLFSYCVYPHTGTLNLQSWVPDWPRARVRSPLQERIKPLAARSLLQPAFQASKDLKQPPPVHFESQCWDQPLSLHAIKACTVAAIGEAWEANGHSKWLHSLQILAESTSSSVFEKSQAIWSTALAGQELRKENTKPRLFAETVRQLDLALDGTSFSIVTADFLTDAGLAAYVEAMQIVGEGRRVFATSTGKLACGPEEVEVGDVVVVIPGSQVPFVVRKHSNVDQYVMLGEAYVNGCMDGEVVDADLSVEPLVLC